jgi:hypothetical protein
MAQSNDTHAAVQARKPGNQLQLSFSPAYSRPPIMKMRFLLSPLLLLASVALVLKSDADPILPYQQPIAAKLMDDINANNGDLQTLNRALTAYHKTSKSLSADLAILQNLNSILANTADYPPLIVDAANAYQNDFEAQRDALAQQLLPAPITELKTSARTSLGKLTKTLSNSVHATTISKLLGFLRTAASQVVSASNSVQRALKAPVGLSIMTAHIGALAFDSTKGFITGGTNFQTTDGGTIGEFADSGVLTVSAIDSGPIVRGIHLHVEGVGTNFPATYPLGVDGNRAFYDATDIPKKREYHFQVDPLLTNSVVTNAWLAIDFVGSNYMLGRFAFRGTNANPFGAGDTNAVVTVSSGEFQLNFHH